MTLKKLLQNNKQAVTISKYLKKSSVSSLGGGIESPGHLSESLEKRDYYLPQIDYSAPENFVKFGSAEKYYQNVFDYVSNYYPYDGSGFDKVKFYNDAAPLEKYFLDNIYPRSTGFVNIGADYGTPTSHSSGYFAPQNSAYTEYIQVKGGPHLNTQYSTTANRTSNLEFGGDNGSTVEFFFRKPLPIDISVESPRQVIVDLWNGEPSGSATYGRVRVEIERNATSNTDRFYVTMRSGSSGFQREPVPTAGNITLADDTWRYFSFKVNTSASITIPSIDFFVNGKCIQTNITSSDSTMHGVLNVVTGSLIADMGALRTAPSGNAYTGVDMEGYGKLSASLDEFRFWKIARTDQEIGRYWFDNVEGGTDKHSANVGLGVYYKFNEGITQTASIDQVVLDYSGRVSNGYWQGYNSLYGRNTGSAINTLALTSKTEEGDVIIRQNNPIYKRDRSGYLVTGSSYDAKNSSRLLNHLPNWIIENDESHENELLNLTQILSSYFDTLHNQLSAIDKIKHVNYISGSAEKGIYEYTHTDRLIENLGLEAPEIFENMGTLEQFLQRDEQIDFEQRLVQIKNSIYKNIYNNLTFIFKSKGNEKAIRNMIRCLGVGDEIISLVTYANNMDYEITDNFYIDSSPKRFVDFSSLTNASDAAAVVYQYYDATNPNSQGQLTGSQNYAQVGYTLQGDFLFPDKRNIPQLTAVRPSVVRSSLFGFHTPADTALDSVDLTWAPAASDYGLEVYAIKSPAPYAEITTPMDQVRDAYFAVYSRAGTLLLTSSIYRNVYDNKKWSLSLSVKPKNYPWADGVLSSRVSSSTDGYTLELYGVNFDGGVKRESFTVSSELNYGFGFSSSVGHKRVYTGCHRTNHTGAILYRTDMRASSIRYWTDYIPTGTVDSQAQQVDTFGRLNPYRNAYSFQNHAPPNYIPKIQTLALDWDFTTVTGSNASGRFNVVDFSSGSSEGTYPSSYQGVSFSAINLRQHTGRGDFFTANATPAEKGYIYASQLQPLEYIGGDKMVSVEQGDAEAFGPYVRPESFYFAVEKSLYRSISLRMLQLFASIDDFNTLVGEPVNKYRLEYKRLAKIREIFFRKVRNQKPDLEKYMKFYKWLDTSMSEIIEQLFPASAAFAPSVRKIVENHVLERPKITHRLPYVKKKILTRDPGDPTSKKIPPGIFSVTIDGDCARTGGWRFNHAPLDNKLANNCRWWKLRAKRSNPYLGIPADAQASAEAIRLSAFSGSKIQSKIVCMDTKLKFPLVGGINQGYNKKRRLLDLTFDSFQFGPRCNDDAILEPGIKKKPTFRVTLDGTSYAGHQLAPFTAISSSVTSGYRASLITLGLTNVDLTNLHEDSVLPYRHSVPMQGPFTERFVGGIQARHEAPLKTVAHKRAEAYVLSITAAGTGSISRLTAHSTPRGHYLRGAGSKSPLNIANIKTNTASSFSISADGVRVVGNYLKNYEVVQTTGRRLNNLDFVSNPSYYGAAAPTAFLTPPARRALGLTGSADYAAPRQRTDTPASAIDAIDTTGANAGITAGTDVVFTIDIPASAGGEGGIITITMQDDDGTGVIGAGANAIGIGGMIGAPGTAIADSQFAERIINAINGISGDRVTLATSGRGTSGVVAITAAQGSSNTQITLTMATGGKTGNVTGVIADVSGAPIVDVTDFTGGANTTDRTNQTIFVNRFAAPGGKTTSKQQFRDVLSDEYSPNNALPYRNIPVRRLGNYGTRTTGRGLGAGAGLDGYLRLYTGWGGFQASIKPELQIRSLAWWNAGLPSPVASSPVYGPPNISNLGIAATKLAALHKTQRNGIKRIEILATSPATTYRTGTLRDNAMVTRPIPAADRSVWTAYISGSDPSVTYANYIRRRSRYPDDIYFQEEVLTSLPSMARSVRYDIQRKKQFLWDKNYGFVPWVQLSEGDSNASNHYAKTNTYELPPYQIEADEAGIPSSVVRKNVVSTKSRTVTDSALEPNTTTYYYSNRYREAPVTSRFKPLTHQIRTPYGTPDQTSTQKTILNLEYSYGNSLMAFANRTLNKRLLGRRKNALNIIKRPYEILRDQVANPAVPDTVNGVDLIKVFSYPEIIYPKEIYTYLSGTRARLAFVNKFWKNDKSADITAVAGYTNYTELIVPANIRAANRQYLRTSASFITSQGYKVLAIDQTPFNRLDVGTPDPTGFGSGSIWPLDSYFYSDATGSLDTTLKGSSAVLLADASTMMCGELMMNYYGTINDEATNPAYTGGNALFHTSSLNSAKYIYGVPTAQTDKIDTPLVYAEPRSPGGAFTRPSWTAGSDRRFVDGLNKRLPHTASAPFYNSYEDYVQHVRLVGKDETILPEFRVSAHVKKYSRNGSIFALISGTLELTGANTTNFDGTNPEFYQRYCQTDTVEFLENFMPINEGKDFIFNNWPRHFEIKSEGIIKLLPYEGFYPVLRTLDLARAFSASLGDASTFVGLDSPSGSSWRTILRPYYAPGILYNSIKAGVAVDYPLRLEGYNTGAFNDTEMAQPLQGPLSRSLPAALVAAGQMPKNRRRAVEGEYTSFDFTDKNVDNFFWASRLPFESIISPLDDIGSESGKRLRLSDVNPVLSLHVTASVKENGVDEVLYSAYKKMTSNFLANVPKFFLRRKSNPFAPPGYLTKFVSNYMGDSKDSENESSPWRAESKDVDKDAAYMMEIGLLQTDKFNLYSNPYAFGQPTATGSTEWGSLVKEQLPRQLSWPKHRGEFAPFAPPYYYGPSLVRFLFMPRGDKISYTLNEIINNTRGELFVQYLNSSGSFYDFASGSYTLPDGTTTSTDNAPDYQWNRAWQNRMDIDASISLFNRFPLGEGGEMVNPMPNRWCVMPKWECPALDFPSHINEKGAPVYNFSASVNVGEFNKSTQGMWHQYGSMPDKNKGIYMYLKDIPTGESEEYDYVKIGTLQPSGPHAGLTTGETVKVKKIPAITEGREVKSLADLCGFHPDEIIRQGMDYTKAKRLGELEDEGPNQKTMSEAILAIPFYEAKDRPRLIRVRAPATALGPKIKEFRQQFTKFSLPPVLANHLLDLLPQSYPRIPELVNPFGPDELDAALPGTKELEAPVVYLMQHKINLSRQDLSDIWQGVMPSISQRFAMTLSSIDHYMPGDNVEENMTQFPEVLKEQLRFENIPRDGHPRYDLLDVVRNPDTEGIFPEIKWLIFKVKQKGCGSYAQLIQEEIFGEEGMGFEDMAAMLGLTLEQARVMLGADSEAQHAKTLYKMKHSLDSPTYNWPYDNCSLIEVGKIATKFGFRPDLKTEFTEGLEPGE